MFKLNKNGRKQNENKLRNQKPLIVLMARWHATYRCKKRLAKDIGESKASRIQGRLTEHTISVAKQVQNKDLAEVRLAISGLGKKAAKRWAKHLGIKKVSLQGEGCLGLRMKRQLCSHLEGSRFEANKTRKTIFIGTDLPHLCFEDLSDALTALEEKELVLGPAIDGGYWLIGLSENLAGATTDSLFTGIPWGTNEVLEKTTGLAKSKGIDFELLRLQNDLDTINDLSPWNIKI